MKKILFLTANPYRTESLKLTRELRDIQQEELLKAKYRDDFTCIQRNAVRWEDIERAILEVKPRIVHFSGHGAGTEGLVIEDDQGNHALLPTEILSDLFQQMASSVECVLLNACYSQEQAAVIHKHINYVIGMNQTIADDAAIAYATGFYRALGARESIQNAHATGCRGIRFLDETLGKNRDILSGHSQAVLQAAHLIPELFVKEPLTAFPDALSQDVRGAIEILVDSLTIPEIHKMVIQFGADFHVACEQIQLLKFYKKLHDLLHKVEIECYRNILLAARHFPDDEITLTTLTEYELVLRGLIQDAQEIIQSQSNLKYDRFWISHLEKACDLLQSAIADLDKRQLKKTVFVLTQLLADQPIRLNTSLTDTAKVLRLPHLIQNLQNLWQSMDAYIEDKHKIQPFKEGITSLANLSFQLDELIQVHDTWQVIDSILRRIETNLNRDTDELEWSWTDLQAKADPLCQDESEPDIRLIRKSKQNLDQALATQDPVKIRRHFSVYRRAILMHFSAVDLNLVDFCDELQKVGHSLELLVGRIS